MHFLEFFLGAASLELEYVGWSFFGLFIFLLVELFVRRSNFFGPLFSFGRA
jgi:hypothetical protein